MGICPAFGDLVSLWRFGADWAEWHHSPQQQRLCILPRFPTHPPTTQLTKHLTHFYQYFISSSKLFTSKQTILSLLKWALKYLAWNSFHRTGGLPFLIKLKLNCFNVLPQMICSTIEISFLKGIHEFISQQL